MEKTFLMVKPDGVQRAFIGEIVARFEKKGYIQKENGKSRTLRIEGISYDDNGDAKDYCNVPLLGKVTAGQPILAV